jgi:hypothetical protein
MDLEAYPLFSNNHNRVYEFYSEGPRGKIKKIVFYKQLEEWGGNIFNLSFGDWDEEKQKINDKVTSNNADRKKVLFTIAATVLDFTKHYPGAVVYARGVTPSRTRLYQIGIASYLEEITQLFKMYGFSSGTWEDFKRGRNYEAFIAKSK